MNTRSHIEGSLYENVTWFGLTRSARPVKRSVAPVVLKEDYSCGITIFPDVFTTTNPKYTILSDIIERIKNGNSRELVGKIRSCTSKAEKENLKKELPSICFSGIFTQRNNASLVRHSGYVVLDYDNVPKEFKAKVCKNPYVRAAFVSPSGNGLKVVVKISGDHIEVCEKLGQYFPKEGLDLQTDVSRVCFESYDPEVYFNNNSLEFNG